jgi:hypothetical protein
MAYSTLIPTWRGWLTLAVGLALAVIVPALIPAYDGPGISTLQVVIAVLTAVVTAAVCVRCFQKGRAADRVASFVTAAFAAWMLYELIRRIV